MTPEGWEALRHTTIDTLITNLKPVGPAFLLKGWTTPERWPFVVVIVVAKPGNEKVIELTQEFHDKVMAGAPIVTLDHKE